MAAFSFMPNIIRTFAAALSQKETPDSAAALSKIA